ncbi:MAG: SPOR domain-containing protein [Magnetococcales bacterium]|nr:SPOR domain-containing protein [Magnetococcales bacterium]
MTIVIPEPFVDVCADCDAMSRIFDELNKLQGSRNQPGGRGTSLPSPMRVLRGRFPRELLRILGVVAGVGVPLLAVWIALAGRPESSPLESTARFPVAKPVRSSLLDTSSVPGLSSELVSAPLARSDQPPASSVTGRSSLSSAAEQPPLPSMPDQSSLPSTPSGPELPPASAATLPGKAVRSFLPSTTPGSGLPLETAAAVQSKEQVPSRLVDFVTLSVTPMSSPPQPEHAPALATTPPQTDLVPTTALSQPEHAPQSRKADPAQAKSAPGISTPPAGLVGATSSGPEAAPVERIPAPVDGKTPPPFVRESLPDARRSFLPSAGNDDKTRPPRKKTLAEKNKSGTAQGMPKIQPGHFLVLVGTYANPDTLETSRNKVLAAGFPVRLRHAEGADSTLTHVQVGPFASREDAQKVAASIRKKTGLPAVDLLSRYYLME